tara:strand:+ start:102 stop:386 length:285 start_codon:yes stop_codon:yes gene_type:complete
MWPPTIGSFLVILAGASWRIGGVCENISGDVVEVVNELWLDVPSESVRINRDSVLPIRAQFEVVSELSKRTRSGRTVVYKLINIDAVTALTSGL